MKNPDVVVVGAKVRYIKTHEGHLGVITGTATNEKGVLMKISMRCECGAALWLYPKDVEVRAT